MSSITRTLARRVAIQRPAFSAVQATRPFTTTLQWQKSPIDSVKDGVKKVDRTVSNKLADGLDVAGLSTSSPLISL